jgi:hypothetical protein
MTATSRRQREDVHDRLMRSCRHAPLRALRQEIRFLGAEAGEYRQGIPVAARNPAIPASQVSEAKRDLAGREKDLATLRRYARRQEARKAIRRALTAIALIAAVVIAVYLRGR